MMKWTLYYLAAINTLGVAIMAWDKEKARRGAWRVPEKNIMFVALAGGSAGVYLGLKLFRHKTGHFKFNFIIPVIIITQLGSALWLYGFR